MAAHAAVPGRSLRPHHLSAALGVPLVLGVLYGIYVAFRARDGSSLTGWNVLLGVLCGLIVTALGALLVRNGGALPRELRAGAYGALFGVAMGFLHSLGDTSILRSVTMGAVLGAALAAASFYVFYTRE
ncbi:hypothetical protein [Streptomyces sp. H27-C3]|uniref:hypothetical protein n=1 Tax=Streptomyces sp. H27-C3 TaxID=3046305 RepID=UPI0024BA5090|nr:hypothetical protein [Streptomyces sp. H27-C3]MDJ0461936.1 hypothetical protein [Streptomyces sp. H27-C3]